jgi:phosphatidylethanolamine-binding protein (PEBP) family uncharacterized protein
MIRRISTGLALAAAVVVSQLAFASAASAADLKVKVADIKAGGAIPGKYAFCVPAAQGHTAPGSNISPPISWSKGPKGTQSYVVIMTDTDSPKENRDKMNKEGVTVPSTGAQILWLRRALRTVERRERPPSPFHGLRAERKVARLTRGL